MNASIKNLTHAIARAVLGVEAPPQETSLPEQLAELSEELSAAGVEIEQLNRSNDLMRLNLRDAEQEHARLLRVSQEYFCVIEDLNDQREQWKDMYFTQSRSHQGAQSMLGQALWLARRQLEIALKALVDFDKPNAEAMIARLGELEAPPIGEPLRFADAMIALAEKAKPQTDAFGARARIAEAAAAPAVAARVAELNEEEQV